MPEKIVKIILPDGNPKNVKKASIVNEKIKITQIPRAILAKNNKLLDFKGIYILVDSLKLQNPQIYIGKGNVKDRTYLHASQKAFWNIVFAIELEENPGFNDAHTSYLEHYFIKKARKIKQAIMDENKQLPKCPCLAEEIITELNSYIQTIEILLSLLGLKCFQPIEDPNIKPKNLLICKDKYGNRGKGEYTEEGLLLHKGAICKLELHKGTKYIPQRDEMIASGLLKEKDGHYVLQSNKIFSSVSTAASIVLGRQANGWNEWKNEEGESLDSLERTAYEQKS